MADTPKWPAYSTGPQDSIFALGVASSKFAELESVLQFIFSTIFQLESDHGQMMFSKIGSEAVLDLNRRAMPSAEILKSPRLPTGVIADVEYFLDGFELCLKNRNHLMHSNFAWNTEPILYKTTKKGQTQIALPTLRELRQIADDMYAFSLYGRLLGNAINNRKFEPPIFSDAIFPWPDRPPLPQELRYSSGPQALRTPQDSQPPPASSQA